MADVPEETKTAPSDEHAGNGAAAHAAADGAPAMTDVPAPVAAAPGPAAAATPSKPAAATPAASSSSGSSSKDSLTLLPSRLFWSRLHALYDSWRKGGKAWGAMPPAGAPPTAPATGPAVDSIALVYGPASDETDEYDRAIAVQLYLFGYEFPDTAIAFCREPDTVIIITSAKKCRLLEQISKDDKPLPIKLQLHIANKADKNAGNIQTFVKALMKSKSGKRCGTIPDKKDAAAPASGLSSGLQAALKKSGLEVGVDVSAGFASVLAIKDAYAKECLVKAAHYSGRVLKKVLVKKIEDIIDQEQKIAQSDIADLAEDAIKDPAKIGEASVRAQ
jgi:nucleosome binding factor SPN SPT16 subunit